MPFLNANLGGVTRVGCALKQGISDSHQALDRTL